MSSLTSNELVYRDAGTVPGDADVGVCFPDEVEDAKVLGIIRDCQDWLVATAASGLREFFNSLATVLKKTFGSQLVTVWDYNEHGRCLVLQASLSETHSVVPSHSIPLERSSTGLAVARRGFVYYPEIHSPGGGRLFGNPLIAATLNLASMVSAPVFDPTDADRVRLVINFCFDAEHAARFPVPKADAVRLLDRLGMALQYQVYRRDKGINDRVRVHAASAKGIHSLFGGISEPLQELTQCTGASLFTWDEANKRLELETSTSAPGAAGAVDYESVYEPQLVAVCVRAGEPLVARIDLLSGEGPLGVPSASVQCPFMAVPVRSSANQVIGVLTCREPVGGDRRSSSFSSLDLHAMETFAGAMAPSIERFLRLRQESGMKRSMRTVSQAMAQADDLESVLQRAIEALTEVFNAEVGSIYLREEDTDTFRIRAAKGTNEKLLPKPSARVEGDTGDALDAGREPAAYALGEGITGTIATGKLLNFKSLAEMRAHPNHSGKYDKVIWGETDHEVETFLGVPISVGEEVIGVWKLSNVAATPEHPEAYFTDEDVQLAQIVSSLIAYAIENYRREEMLLKQFTRVAVNSIKIQRALDEEDAIRVVMNALEETRLAGALLSLYDPQARELSSVRAAGRTWRQAATRKCGIEDDDIRAVVLRTGREEFVRDSARDLRCRNNPLDVPLAAQYVLPLRLGDELIGTLQIDMGKRARPRRNEQLVLKAFAGHLAIALSRRRSIQQTLDLTNQVLASSRFITAEALSGMAVHSLHHKLAHITSELRKELGRREVRESRLLHDTLTDWKARLGELEADLKNALLFIRAPLDEAYAGKIDLHPEIQKAISTWINYLYNNKCAVKTVFKAERSECRLPAEAFREIVSVLLVNAVQAHAKHVEIRTLNESNVKPPSGKIVKSAFCLECSDDGVGLATQEYEKIFEANYTTKPKTFGTGLGLFIARRLARDGGGDLEVIQRGHQGKGATFRLTLPVVEGRK